MDTGSPAYHVLFHKQQREIAQLLELQLAEKSDALG
jgi:hypothetical protein